MSDLENKKTEETPKKRPYNLREKKDNEYSFSILSPNPLLNSQDPCTFSVQQ